jgi:GAF domain-containing protein
MVNQLPLDELSIVFARIKGLLLTEEKVDRAVQLLAKAAKEAIPGSTGAGVSLIDSRGHKTSSGATDRIVEQADAAQYELGQGPCLTAWATGETVVLDDVANDPRWPDWSAAMVGLPVRSVVSTPLISDKQHLGALKVYAALPSAYDSHSIRMLETLATPTATLLANIQSHETPQRISQTLETALRSRDTVSRACGVLMERHGLTEEEAMQELLKRVRAGNTSILQASVRIIAGLPSSQG